MYPKGVGIENKNELYLKLQNNVKGFIAQGSEEGFGKKYARGINDKAFQKDKFIQVVSCNTHNISSITNTIGISSDPENLLKVSMSVLKSK